MLGYRGTGRKEDEGDSWKLHLNRTKSQRYTSSEGIGMIVFDHPSETGNGPVVIDFDLDNVIIRVVIRPDKAQ